MSIKPKNTVEAFINAWEKPTCNHCKKELVRKTFDSGKVEAVSQMKNRKYCDNDCYQAEQSEKAETKRRGKNAIDKFCFSGWRE